MTMQYAVELYPFVAVAFAADAGTGPIASRAVEIATAYATGPRPKSFMPPDYTTHSEQLPSGHEHNQVVPAI